MPKLTHPDCIKEAFELYLKYNGERFDLIESEMRQKGWHSFDKQCLSNRGIGKNFREGWIEQYGWKKSLEIKIATAGTVADERATSPTKFANALNYGRSLALILDNDKGGGIGSIVRLVAGVIIGKRL